MTPHSGDPHGGFRRRAAAVVSGVVGSLLLAACSSSGSGGAAPTPTPVALTRDTCVDRVYQGRHLGVTTPTGFTVDLTPEDQKELADIAGVHLLAEMYLRPKEGVDEPGLDRRTVEINVYANGPGDRFTTGQDALAYIVLGFVSRVAGSGSGLTADATATPTTIDGGRGGVGDDTDPRALGASDSAPARLHWWTVQVGDTASGVQFIVAMAAKTKALDAQYQPLIQGGLHIGGCPTPKAR